MCWPEVLRPSGKTRLLAVAVDGERVVVDVVVAIVAFEPRGCTGRLDRLVRLPALKCSVCNDCFVDTSAFEDNCSISRNSY